MKLFKETSGYKSQEKEILKLLTKTDINFPTENIDEKAKTDWHTKNKEILANSIIKPIFKFTLKYMYLLQNNNNMLSTKNHWEKTYTYNNNTEILNYHAIKKELNEKILTTTNNLLDLINTNMKELKSKDSELEDEFQKIQDIFKKYIKNFEDTSSKETLINSLITTVLNFYTLDPDKDLALEIKPKTFNKDKVKEINQSNKLNPQKPKKTNSLFKWLENS